MRELDKLIENLPTLEQIREELARRGMLSFAKFVMPNYEAAIHHIAVCTALDLFLKGIIKKLAIYIPPQHGKSQLSSILFPAYALGINPDLKIAVCSYSDSLSSGFNRACQRIIESPEYLQLFPGTRLNGREVWANHKAGRPTYLKNSDIFEIVNRKGFFKNVGIGTALTGTPVDIGIIDDPLKDRIEAESERMRDNVWNWYTDVFKTRLHNGSQELLLQTRWHEDDLGGRLEAEDAKRIRDGLEPEWTIIKYPAIKEEPPTALDPRQIGEALWPERHSVQLLLDKKRISGERTFNSLYQQNPQPLAGNIIPTDRFPRINWEEFLRRTKNKFVAWKFKIDGAFTEDADSNDPTALYASCFVDNIQYVRRSESVYMNYERLLEYIPQFVMRYGYNHNSIIEVEPKANGISIVQSIYLRTKLNVMKYEYPKIMGTTMYDKDKVTRAMACIPTWLSSRVVLVEEDSSNPWIPVTIKQYAGFPASKHDDEVDLLVQDTLQNFFTEERKRIETEN